MLSGIGGMVLSGGSDVDPALYGEPATPECGETDRERDDYEIALLREAQRLDIPVLAICRGMQLLNVACGGSLIQHLENSAKHKTEPHEVTVGGPMRSLFGVSRMRVNSRHHQAVAVPGEGVVISIRDSEDGVVEGFCLPSARWAYGVQWHPEDMPEDLLQRELFQKFADAVQQHLAR